MPRLYLYQERMCFDLSWTSETRLYEMLPIPRVFTNSSTLLVEIPLDVGFLHDHGQRPLGASARLQ